MSSDRGVQPDPSDVFVGPLEPVGGGGVVTHLQHVQQRRLSGIVEAEEQQLGVLVEQAERREDVVNCRGERRTFMSASCPPRVG